MNKQSDIAAVNGRTPLRHWIIQALISLVLGGLVSATAAVVAIKYEIKETRLTVMNAIELRAEKQKAKLEDHERRISINEDVINRAFPRRYKGP